jgi:ATP-dependent HslUV protease subunit HslV
MFKGTTVLCVRKDGKVALGADGQVTLGQQIIKGNARKVRRLGKHNILAGFAGSTADAMTLLERFEKSLEEHSGNLMKASISLVREWRSDKALRRLEALMLVADAEQTLLLSGSGDVLQPEGDAAAIGSGSGFALAAARAFLEVPSPLSAEEIVQKGLGIASEICIYTNSCITLEVL